MGVSIAGYLRRSDGYYKKASRTVPGETDGNAAPLEQDAIRLKLKVQIAEGFDATLAYNFTHVSDPRGNLFTPYENVSRTITYNDPGGATLPTKLGVAAFDYETEVSSKQHEGTLTLGLDTGIGRLMSYTGYSRFVPTTSFDFDGSYVNAGWSTSMFKQLTFQQAVDFQIDAIDRLDLIIGANYLHDDLDTIAPNIAQFAANNPTAPGTTPPTRANLIQIEDRQFSQKKKAWAVYADAMFHLTDALTINAGGRYSKEAQDVFAVAVDPRSGAFNFPATSKGSNYKKFTPRASIRYEIAPRTNVYASWSKGFRSGAWNAALPTNPSNLAAAAANWTPADQESITAYEVGFKTAGSNFRAEIAGFYYDYTDLQVSLTSRAPICDLPSTPQPCSQVTTLIANAPKAKIKGVEGSFEWQPVENLKLRGGITWLHARYGNGFFFNGVGVNAALPARNTNSDPLKQSANASQVQNLSGKQMSRAPDWTANFGIEYNIPNGDGGLAFSTNVNYTDSYVVTNPSVWCDPTASNGAICAATPADRRGEQRFVEGAFARVSAQVTWTDPSGHYYGRVWGNNLTDHRYRLHYTGTATGTYSPMAEPRTYGVTAGVKF